MVVSSKYNIRLFWLSGKKYVKQIKQKYSRNLVFAGAGLSVLAVFLLNYCFHLNWHASVSIVVVLVTLALNILTHLPTEVVFLGGLSVLLVSGILPVGDVLAGFSNPGMITVGVLYVVIEGVEQTGGLTWISQYLLGSPKTLVGALARLAFPISGLSAFLNNTPIVALFIPIVHEWARKLGIHPSKLLIPLSYSAIFGGICTLIGTSTNLVVNGLLIAHTDHPGLGIFEITKVTLPCALAGCLYLLTIGHRLLPNRKAAVSPQDDLRQYMLEMIISAESPLVGQTIEQAGLRSLQGVYLSDLMRQGEVIPVVSHQQRLCTLDRLIFVGMIDSIADLRRIPGIYPATREGPDWRYGESKYALIEVVVSNQCSFIGKTIREGHFRRQYGAVVIAVARDGDRVLSKIGDIVLHPSDALLLEASEMFIKLHRNSREFYIVSHLPESESQRFDLAPTALAIMVGMMVVVAIGWLDMLAAVTLAAICMVAFGCCSVDKVLRRVDWALLMVIASSLGLGKALASTGAANMLADVLVNYAGNNPYLALCLMYLATMLLTEMITNNAAAALVFPVGISVSEQFNVSFLPFVIAIMIAASASFVTPIGYQTNLMVYSAGGYRFTDFIRIGVPLSLIFFVVTVILTPTVFPFIR